MYFNCFVLFTILYYTSYRYNSRTKYIYVQNIFKIYNIYFTYIFDEKMYN